MGRGEGSDSSSIPPRRQRRLINRFETIRKNHGWLQRGLSRYPDAASFAEDWVSEEFAASEHIAALERFYDRIVNSLNQVIDTVEGALENRGEIEDPMKPGGPGRTRRLATYEVIEEKDVEPLKRYLERRNIFQKEYPDLGAEAGRDAFEDVGEFLKLLPKLTPALRQWAEDVVVGQ